MQYLFTILAAAFAFCPASSDAAENDYKTVVEGEWSEPVHDSRGYALSGRLIIATKMRADGLRDTAVFIELKDANDSIDDCAANDLRGMPITPRIAGSASTESEPMAAQRSISANRCNCIVTWERQTFAKSILAD